MTDLAPVQVPTSGARSTLRMAVVVAVVFAAVLEVLDSTIVNVALPHIIAAFGATTDQATWILTSYTVAAVIVMPLTGLMARRVGRRTLILTAIVGFTVFSMLCGLSWSLETMVVFRMAQGLFGAFLIPLSQSILFDAFPRDKRGQAMALFGLGVVVAPVLGPTLGALLTDYFSWRMVFFVNLPVAALALLLLAGELPKDEPSKVPIDYWALLWMAMGIGLLQFILDQGESEDWLSSHTIQLAVVGAVLGLVLFVVRNLRQAQPLVDLKLFANRNFAIANIVIAGFAVGMFGGIAILPLFVQDLLGYPVTEAGYLFIPRGLAAAFSMIVVGAVLSNRVDPRVLAAIGLLLVAAGNFMMAGLNLNADFWQLAWPGVVSSLGMGFVFVPMSTLAFDRIGSDAQDEASGLYGVIRQLGSSIGIAIVGALLVQAISTNNVVLASYITPFSQAARSYLAPLGLTPMDPAGAAIIAGQISGQAQMMAYSGVFFVLGVSSLALMPLLLAMAKPTGNQRTAVA